MREPRIKEVVREGVREGTSPHELARQIRKLQGPSADRATTIARGQIDRAAREAKANIRKAIRAELQKIARRKVRLESAARAPVGAASQGRSEMTKTYAVELKAFDVALLSNLRRMAHEHAGQGTAAYLDLLNRVDLAFTAPLSRGDSWHSPPVARLYFAELIDAERLIYRVPPGGEVLAVFDGAPDQHATAGLCSVTFEELPALTWTGWPPEGPPPTGRFRLANAPAFPVTALVREPNPTSIERPTDDGGPLGKDPNWSAKGATFDDDVDGLKRLAEWLLGAHSETAASLGTDDKPKPPSFLGAPDAPETKSPVKETARGPSQPNPVINAEGGPVAGDAPPLDPSGLKHTVRAWDNGVESQVDHLGGGLFRVAVGGPTSDPPKPPLGAVPDFVWRHRRAKELSAAIDRYLDWADDPAVDGRNLPAWAAELAEHLRWLADREVEE